MKSDQSGILRWLAILVFIGGIIPYLNTIGHDFAWDDKSVITNNKVTTAGYSGLSEIWSNTVYMPYRQTWRPVTQTSHALMYQWFGDNPMPEHLLNVLLFGLCCLLAFPFASKLFNEQNPFLLALAILIFAFHPVHTEVVANVKGRDEILSFLFGIGSLWQFTVFISDWRKNGWRLLLVIGLITLAMLSKFNAVTLLAVFPLIVWYRAEKEERATLLAIALSLSLVLLGFAFYSEWLALSSILPMAILTYHEKRTLPYVAGVVLLAPLAFFYYRNYLGPYDVNRPVQTLSEPGVLNNVLFGAEGFSEWSGTILAIMGKYIQLFVFPHPLVQSYGYEQISIHEILSVTSLSSLFVYGGLAVIAVLGFRRKTSISFGIIFFLLTISIYSQIVQPTADTLAERNLFLPSLGLSLVLVLAINMLMKKLGSRNALVKLYVLLPVLLLLGLKTIDRNRDWKDDLTLAENSIQYMEKNAVAQANLGHFYLQAHDETSDFVDRRRFRRKAFDAWYRCLEIYPEYQAVNRRLTRLHLDVGFELAKQGKGVEAANHFKSATVLDPDNVEAWFMHANAMIAMGQTSTASSSNQRALKLDASYQPAIRLQVLIDSLLVDQSNPNME